jgi:ATP/ADP translocase
MNAVTNVQNDIASPSKKKGMSFMESLRFVFSSSYILKIGVMVISYATSMSLLEIYYLNIFQLFWLESTITGFSLSNGITGSLVILLCLTIGGMLHLG